MRRILITILTVLSVAVLTGCTSKNEDSKNEITTCNTDDTEQDMFGTQFVIIESETLQNKRELSSTWYYRYTVYDVDSKVMYYIFDGYNRATMSPVYNSDGTVKIYEEN